MQRSTRHAVPRAGGRLPEVNRTTKIDLLRYLDTKQPSKGTYNVDKGTAVSTWGGPLGGGWGEGQANCSMWAASREVSWCVPACLCGVGLSQATPRDHLWLQQVYGYRIQ